MLIFIHCKIQRKKISKMNKLKTIHLQYSIKTLDSSKLFTFDSNFTYFYLFSIACINSVGRKIGVTHHKTIGCWLSNAGILENFVLIKYFWIFIYLISHFYLDKTFCLERNSSKISGNGSNLLRNFL